MREVREVVVDGVAKRARSTDLTHVLAEFSVETEFSRLPGTVVIRLAQCLLDFVSVSVAGRLQSESTEQLITAVDRFGPVAGSATTIGLAGKRSCRDAALLNGAFAHSLDFDDTNIASGLHPGASVIACALATAESVNADSRALIAALASGYEVCCRLGIALGHGAYTRGFHPTAIAGVFGSVAAGSRLKGFSTDQCDSAFGLAGSMASGSMQYLENGSWNKRLHPGLAAHNAVMAIELTSAGIVGASRAIDGKLGLLVGYTDTPQLAALDDGLARDWILATTGIKLYPACRLTHGAIDAAIELSHRSIDGPPAGARYRLAISPEANAIVGGRDPIKRRPRNSVDAQFSVYFQTAAALLTQAASWDSYELVGSSEIETIIDSIDVNVDPSMAEAGARLEARYSGVPPITIEVKAPSGEPGDDLPWDLVIAKFNGIAAGPLGGERSKAITHMCTNIGDGWPVQTLMDLLGTEMPQAGIADRRK